MSLAIINNGELKDRIAAWLDTGHPSIEACMRKMRDLAVEKMGEVDDDISKVTVTDTACGMVAEIMRMAGDELGHHLWFVNDAPTNEVGSQGIDFVLDGLDETSKAGIGLDEMFDKISQAIEGDDDSDSDGDDDVVRLAQYLRKEESSDDDE